MKFLLAVLVFLLPVDTDHPSEATLNCWNPVLDTGICGVMYGAVTPPLKSACMHTVAYLCQE